MNPPIDISEAAGVRYLHFGSDWIQGAMRIRKPYALELAYTREMMAGLLLRDGLAADGGHWPRKVLIIGLGAASLARFVHHHLPQARIRVVEIAPAVVAAARQFFKLPTEDARFSVHLGCGAQFVLEHDETWDYVLVDGFDRNARAGVLDTEPFHQAVRARLIGARHHGGEPLRPRAWLQGQPAAHRARLSTTARSPFRPATAATWSPSARPATPIERSVGGAARARPPRSRPRPASTSCLPSPASKPRAALPGGVLRV
jgi:hypothetical protein